MNVSPDFDKLSAIKEEFEGFKNIAYKDSGGVWTLGTGFTYNYAKQRKVQEGDVISRATNVQWTQIAHRAFLQEINQYIKVPLNPHQSAALTDYVFNRGLTNFLSTQLDELINANPNDPKILDEFLRTGLKDRLGNLLWGLGRRRRAQAYLYFTGELKFKWPKWSKVSIT